MDSSIALGTPAQMLRKNEHPETSHEAADQLDSADWEFKVLNVVRHRWDEFGLDTIADDALECYGISDQRDKPVSESSIRARFSGLQRKGYICLNGERDGHRFGKSQQSWRPMTEDERLAFLQGRAGFEDVVIDSTALGYVGEWWNAQHMMQQWADREAQMRCELVQRLLKNAPLGKYEFDLPNNCLLVVDLQSNGESKIKTVAMTERQRTMRLRRIAEREAARIAPVQDTVDLSSFYNQ